MPTPAHDAASAAVRPRPEATDHAAGFRVTVVAFRSGTVLRMLVVRVELWPGGDAKRARELGRLALANVSGLAPVSDYVCVAVDDLGEEQDVIVRNHERAAGFWSLVARAVDFERAEPVPDEFREVVSAVFDRLVDVPMP